jgi:carbonic anhydrase
MAMTMRAITFGMLLCTSTALASHPAVSKPSPGHAPTPPEHAAPQHATTDDDAHAAPKVNLAAVTPDEALQRLIEGNDRFRYGESDFPRFDPARRHETFSDGQKPFAALLSCADSRAPVEAIFDQGIGDLFVVRVAGNVADTDEIGTLEYGVGHLNTPLIVVLGHTKCGAVTAVAEGAKVHGHIARLVDNIAPAVEAVKQRDSGAAGNRLVRLAIRTNVMQSMRDLLCESEVIATAVRDGTVRVVGGVYDLQTGAIDWIGPHPQQAELLAGPATGAKSPGHADADAHKASLAAPAQHGHPAPGQDAHAPKHEDQHDHPPADDHGKKPGPHAAAKPAPRKENWTALGALLGGSALASGAAIHLIYHRKS